MRAISIITLGVAMLSLGSDACIDQTAIAKFAWLLSPPSAATMDTQCSQETAVIADLEDLATKCGAELGDLSAGIGLAQDLLCEKQDGEYCLPLLIDILDIPTVLPKVISGQTFEIDFLSFLSNDEKLEKVHSSPNCARKIVKSATEAAREVAKANNWAVNEQITYILDLVYPVLQSIPEDKDGIICATDRDTFLTTDLQLDTAKVCEGDLLKECARKLVGTTRELGIVENLCNSTANKTLIGTVEITLPNVNFAYYMKHKDDVDNLITNYLGKDLMLLLPGVLAENMDISITESDNGGLSVKLDVKSFEATPELLQTFEMLKTLLANKPELISFINLDMLLPDEAFVDATLLVSGNAVVDAIEDLVSKNPGEDSEKDASSASTLRGLSSGLLFFLVGFFIL